MLHRLVERHPAPLHHKADGVAGTSAPEAVVQIPRWCHHERRSLLPVERATAFVVAAFSLELHALVLDDRDDVPLLDLVFYIVGDHKSNKSTAWPLSELSNILLQESSSTLSLAWSISKISFLAMPMLCSR